MYRVCIPLPIQTSEMRASHLFSLLSLPFLNNIAAHRIRDVGANPQPLNPKEVGGRTGRTVVSLAFHIRKRLHLHRLGFKSVPVQVKHRTTVNRGKRSEACYFIHLEHPI